VSLGSVDSLIQHPAGLTHRVVAPEVLAAHGIGPGTLRLSVGLEDVEDLWADLQRGLQAAAACTSLDRAA
jgi:cystathionine beta-lyase/cystathionine gamma-synthase